MILPIHVEIRQEARYLTSNYEAKTFIGKEIRPKASPVFVNSFLCQYIFYTYSGTVETVKSSQFYIHF